MPTDDTFLRHLLSRACAPDAADRALAALAPFAAIGADGRYPLGRASCAEVGAIASALWHAGALHAKGCVFLPSCVPPRPSDAREHGGASLLARLRDRYDPELGKAFADASFAAALDAAIGPALDALARGTAGTGGLSGEDPAALVRYVLGTYAAFAAQGRREADALAPLAALLPSFVPLFEDGRRDGIWYVLSGC